MPSLMWDVQREDKDGVRMRAPLDQRRRFQGFEAVRQVGEAESWSVRSLHQLPAMGLN